MNENQLGKADILIIDDTPENLRLLATMLTKQNYEIRKAINGKIALNAIKAKPPDVILLDINMPEMNGYEVCQQLKASAETREIPVIFISALSQLEEKIKAFQVGGVDYITKPFKWEEVVLRIENQLTIRQQKKQLIQQNILLKQEIKKRKQIEVQLAKANKELERLAVIDSLTGVANRRRFDEYLNEEWMRMSREKAPLSLILSDIDYFKLYNDTYGHPAGDNCLAKVAKGIISAVKRPGDLVTRYGGEEFAVILPKTQTSGAIKIAEEMRLEVTNLNILHQASKISEYVTISLGLASVIPNQKSTPADLIAAADKALYIAKKEGRDRLEFIQI